MVNAQRSAVAPDDPPFALIGAKRGVIGQIVGLRSRIAQMGILALHWIDDADDRMPNTLYWAEQLQDAVADLLHRVLLAIGLADFDRAGAASSTLVSSQSRP